MAPPVPAAVPPLPPLPPGTELTSPVFACPLLVDAAPPVLLVPPLDTPAAALPATLVARGGSWRGPVPHAAERTSHSALTEDSCRSERTLFENPSRRLRRCLRVRAELFTQNRMR